MISMHCDQHRLKEWLGRRPPVDKVRYDMSILDPFPKNAMASVSSTNISVQ